MGATPTPDPWEKSRREGIAKMVREEPMTIWANEHCLMTCGAHTGHSVQVIGMCQDATWAFAISQAVNNHATLKRALKKLIPSGFCADNPNIPDSAIVPVDFTYGELREAEAALSAASASETGKEG